MSALGQKRTHAPQQTASLFDHLVGEREQIWWNGDAERLGRFEVDDQIELGWLHDWANECIAEWSGFTDESPKTNASDTDLGIPDDALSYGRPLSAKELRETEFPPEEFVIEDLILKGWGQPFDGDAGVGKSLLASQSSVHVSHGSPMFGRAVKRQPVLYITHEDNYGPTKDRMLATSRHLGLSDAEFDNLPLLTKCILDRDITLANIDDNGGVKVRPFHKALSAWLRDLPGALVILDCASDVVQMNENLRQPPNAFFKDLLKPLCVEHDATIQVLRHPSKASMKDGTFYAGSTGNRTAIRYGLTMRLLDPDKPHGARMLEPSKRQYWGAAEMLLLEVRPDLKIFVRADDDPEIARTKEEVRAAVLAEIKRLTATGVLVQSTNRGSGQGPREIAAQLKLTNKEVASIINQAIRDGAIRNVPRSDDHRTPAHIEVVETAAIAAI